MAMYPLMEKRLLKAVKMEYSHEPQCETLRPEEAT